MSSNDSLAKHFVYQVSIEAIDRLTVKKLQNTVENILKTKGFFQMNKSPMLTVVTYLYDGES